MDEEWLTISWWIEEATLVPSRQSDSLRSVRKLEHGKNNGLR